MPHPPAAGPFGDRATVQLFLASTLYGAATLAAAIDAGLYGPPGVRRVLVVTTNTPIPEVTVPLHRTPGFGALAGRFTEIRDWNTAIRPQHPAAWAPRPEDVPIWERMLRSHWGLGDAPVRLAVESLQASPARAVADVFADAALDAYADGLMVYGPTRVRLPAGLGRRVERLLYLDLVPGMTPLLLAEHGVAPVRVSRDAFTAVLDELPPAAEGGSGPSTALLLGQYLSSLGILSPEEEDELHLRMLRGAVRAGFREVVFKAHPSAPERGAEALAATAAELGAALSVVTEPVLAERLFAGRRPGLVVGCFSTGLLTAAACYGLPVARVGTELLLNRLTPYQNSNRVPATIVDALLPDLEDCGDRPGPLDPSPAAVANAAGLVRAVGYCMQPVGRADLRGEASAYLTGLPDAAVARYFRRRRLTSLGLPGGLHGRAVIPRNRFTRTAARTARALARTARTGRNGASVEERGARRV